MWKTFYFKIKKLALVEIICKTDNCSYYMHHKFAVIDNSAIITGGFNWSSQAVNHNQENILFLENKNIAHKILMNLIYYVMNIKHLLIKKKQ